MNEENSCDPRRAVDASALRTSHFELHPSHFALRTLLSRPFPLPMPKRDMLINNVPGEECRIAIIEDGKLEELYHERTSVESHVGSIFKAKVTNVEPSIQAAFVDFGLERNGFLHVTDLHPRYFPGQHKEETERVGHKTPHRERPPIQKCLKRGQEILVQVIKEGLGSKGPTVTSYLSIPGRFLVMMPAMERLGVSRKVDDDDARRAMRKLLDELNPPDDFGFIIRTAGMGRPKSDLKRDLAYLVRLWKNLEKRMAQPGVGELYTESDLMIRTIRDVYSTDIDRIIVDEPTAAKRASDFLAIASPRAKSNVLYYEDPVPLFHRYGVEAQIETIHARRVPLPSGGSLVIDSTEALVAIDVNSGKMRNSGDAETTAFRVNTEACDEVCRQLRLRDLGGVVVIDLIDMRSPSKRRAIEARFRENLKRDRARTKPLAISQFGILEMTRQRMRPALTKSVYSDCHYCHGEGTVKNVDAVVLDVMRRLSLVASRKEISKLAVTVSPDVAFPLLNRKRSELVALEQKYNTPIQVRVNPSGAVDFIELLPMDERGNPITIDAMKGLAAPLLHQVESIPVDDDFVDDEIDEVEERATEMENIDEGAEQETEEREEAPVRSQKPQRQEQRPPRPQREERPPREERAPREAASHDGPQGEPQDSEGHGEGSNDPNTSAEVGGENPPMNSNNGGPGNNGNSGGGQDGQGEGGRRRRRRRRGRRGRGGSDGQSQGGPDAQQGATGARPPQGGQQGGQQNRPPQQQGNRPPQYQQNRPPQNQQNRPPQQQGNRPPQGQPGQQGPRPPLQTRGPGAGGPPSAPASRGYVGGLPPQRPPLVERELKGNLKGPEDVPGEEPIIDDNIGNSIDRDGGDGNDDNGGMMDGRSSGGGDGGQPRLGPDGQPLRKRRRRGGRRHRRRREAQMRAQQEGGQNPQGGQGNNASPSEGGERFDDGYDDQQSEGAPITGDGAIDHRESPDEDRGHVNEASQQSYDDERDDDREDEAHAESREQVIESSGPTSAAGAGDAADDAPADEEKAPAKPTKKPVRRSGSRAKKPAAAKAAKPAAKPKKVTKRPTRKPPKAKE